jgi:quercetin dioxygenase-like cupin family protein
MVGEDSIYCIATAEQTGGGYSFLEVHVPAGSGPPQHRHDSSDEWFYILSGTASLQAADLRAEVGPGDYIHVPRGATHAFNATTDMRLVAGYSPGGEESHLFCGADDVADPVAPESQGQERGDAEELESDVTEEVRVARAADVEPVMVGEDSIYCIATAEQTGGGYSFLEVHVPAGSGPPQHRHDSSDEFFYILSGTASLQAADLRAEVGPGDYIHVPRDTTHAFNATTDMRLVAGYSPGGEESHLFCGE